MAQKMEKEEKKIPADLATSVVRDRDTILLDAQICFGQPFRQLCRCGTEVGYVFSLNARLVGFLPPSNRSHRSNY